MMMMIEHVLYVSSESYECFKRIKTLLEKVKEKHQIEYKIFTSKQLDEDSREDLLIQIRTASQRAKIRVTSKGGGILPISRSKKLNIDQIPILIRKEERKISQVFPHEEGPKGSRIEINRYLEQLLEADTFQGFEKQVISEDDIWKFASNFPSKIEEGLKYHSREIEIEGGIIDMVFVDKQGNHVLVEVEIKATDAAIGQVSRFPIPYAEKYNLPRESIRKAIVCIEITDSRIIACKENQIEVYQFGINKRV